MHSRRPPALCLPAPWPTNIDVKVKVPGKGDAEGRLVTMRGPSLDCYRFNVSWSDAIYLRNLEAKQSPYNSGG